MMHLVARMKVMLLVVATSATAQNTPAARKGPRPQAAASTRATVSVLLDGRMIGTNWLPAGVNLAGPATISIDYGQPHLRGRALDGNDILKSPYDSVWRLGANLATQLQTDVDLLLGGSQIARGRYSLFLRTGSEPRLIVSRQTGQWGTEYDSRLDLARIPLTLRTTTESVESFTIWLVPAAAGAEGTFRMAWGHSEWTAPWKVIF